jgi:hypothetical protein
MRVLTLVGLLTWLIAVPAAAQAPTGPWPAPPELESVRSDPGDAPAAAVRERHERIRWQLFGIPVSLILAAGAVVLALFVVAGVVLPRARRRARARGGGTYGRP